MVKKSLNKRNTTKEKEELIEQQEEKEQLLQEHEEQTDLDLSESSAANNKDMEFALNLLNEKFNLGGDYVLTQFKDGAQNCILTVGNSDFEVTVKVKDKFKHQFPSLMEQL